MMAEITTENYLKDLINQKNNFVSALQECGVEADSDEKFNSLVPKIVDVYEAGKAAGDGGDGGYDEGYEAGAMPLYYSTRLYSTWKGVSFPENYEMTVRVKGVSDCGLAFLEAENLKSIKLISDTPDTLVDISSAFRECYQLELIDLTEFNRRISNLGYCLYDSYNLKTILGALDVSEVTGGFPATTFEAKSLESIEFVPNTICANIWFNKAPKLTHDSLMSVINGLKNFVTFVSERYEGASADLEGVTYDPRNTTYYVTNPYIDGDVIKCEATSDNSGEVFNATLYECGVSEEDVPNIKSFFYDIDGSMTLYIEKLSGSATLTLGTTNLAKLTDEEIAIATEKGWTLA